MSASAKYISGQFKNLKAKFSKKPSTALVPTSDVGKNTSTASKIAAEVSRIWKVHIANLKGNYQSIKDTVTTVWEHHKIRVKDSVAYTSAQFAKLKGMAQKVATSMGNIFKKVTAPISKVFNNIVKHASNAFNKIKTSASNMAKATKQAFTSNTTQPQTNPDINAQSWTSASLGNQLLSLGDNASVAKQIQDINNAMAQGEVALNNYMSGLGNTDNALKAYIASLNGGKASLSGFHQFIQTHNAGLEASGVAARLAAVGHTLLNAALSMGLSVLIQFAMEGLGKLIEYLKGVINPTEKLAGELSDLRSEISDIENKIDSLNSELETTKDRIAELTALPSLSFMEQEELKNLKAYNDELERNIKLEEYNLKTKNDAEVAKAENYIKEAWNKQGKYYVNAHGEIKNDSGWSGFWNNSVKTTDAIDKAITKYQSRQEDIDTLKNILTQWDDMSKSERNDFRHTTLNDVSVVSSDYDSETIRRRIEEEETKNTNVLNSINDILNDESYSGLSYGMSTDINKFLDERYAYQLKVQQLQGASIKSDAISSLFDNTSTEELQSLGKKLQDIVLQDVDDGGNEITDEAKRAAILKEIDAINEEADAYNRLNLAMDIVGVTAKDIADYFVLETGRYDSSTIEGITAQYTNALAVMKELQSSRGGDFEIDGQRYGWTDFFDLNEDGQFEANAEEFAKILKGMDDECRNTFMSLVESVRNGELNWDQAIASLSHSGSLAGLKLVSEQLSAINSVTFTSVKDEISGVIDTFGEFGAALEDVASSMELLKAAQVQMNNAGRLSVKTALEIISSTDRWNEVLDISNGQITLQSNATEVLVQDKLDLIKANIQNEIATLEEQISIIESQDASHNLAMTIEESTNVAIRDMAGNMAYLTEIMKAYALIANGQDPGDFLAAADTARETAKNGVEVNYKLNKANQAARTGNLEKQLADAKARLAMMEQIDTEDEYKNNYDFEKTPGDKYDSDRNGIDDDTDDTVSDAWEKLLKKYENQLALITNQRDLVQAEIDQMEATGGKASHKYYKDLIDNSGAEKDLLIEKKKALEDYIKANENNVDQDTWTEMNNEINATAVAIEECTTKLLEYYDALEEIDAHYFEQTTDDISRLGEEIQFVQGLLEDDKVADENGNWTNEAITRLGLYVNEMERAATSADLYKKELNNVEQSWAEYQTLLKNANGDVDAISSNDLNKLYDEYGYVITSAEEFKEKTDELTDSMYDEINAYEDAKDGIIEMNEARIDAIKDGIEKEIEAYEELIELKKEALDAERDLHDFRNDIKNQTKDIATLERRIAALSGSDAAADVAEKRRLEAQLLESKEGLNESYYSHAKDQQSQALDEELTAFQESKDRYIEELELTLENAEQLITNSMMDVLLNADIVYGELNGIADTYGVTLSDELTQPWKDASNQAIAWKNELQQSMTSGEYAALIGEGGAVTAFANGVANKLKGSWNTAKNEAKKYADYLNSTELKTKFGNTITGFGNQIKSLVTHWTNVKNAADDAYRAIERAASVKGKETTATSGGGGSGGGGGSNGTVTKYKVIAKVQANGKTFSHTGTGETAKGARARALEYLRNTVINYMVSHHGSRDVAEARWEKSWYPKVTYSDPVKYAKGTLGTKKDEWAVTDESWIGEEITLAAGKNGQLQYLKKGSAVMPADISANLVEWGKLNPNMMSMPSAMQGLNLMSNYVNKPEIKLDIENFLRCDNVSQDSMSELKKFVNEQMNSFVRQLNYGLKKVGAR
jgi:hypothetical protein